MAAALIAGVSVLAAQGVAVASHQFSDVPTGSVFHNEIGWLADTGITTGFGDGTYRPKDPVTRQAMAAFLQRMFDLRNDVAIARDASGTDAYSENWSNFATASTTVTVPNGTTAMLIADFSGMVRCYGGGTECLVRILVNGSEMSPTHTGGAGYVLSAPDDATRTSNATAGMSMLRYSGPVGPGTYTITVQSTVTGFPSYTIADWTLVAEAILLPAT